MGCQVTDLVQEFGFVRRCLGPRQRARDVLGRQMPRALVDLDRSELAVGHLLQDGGSQVDPKGPAPAQVGMAVGGAVNGFLLRRRCERRTQESRGQETHDPVRHGLAPPPFSSAIELPSGRVNFCMYP
jgi:hypothetical protein